MAGWTTRFVLGGVLILTTPIITTYWTYSFFRRVGCHSSITRNLNHLDSKEDDDSWAISAAPAREIYDYLHWSNSQSCPSMVDFGFGVFDDGQIAAPDGHKAVCLTDGVAPVYSQCLVYSFGINHQWNFDLAMEKFGCQVYSFDPSMTINQRDPVRRRIRFYRLGLDGQNRLHPTKKWTMRTASSIYEKLSKRHGTRPIDVLKLDVEFAEWDAISQMIQSGFLQDLVKQLAVEIHFLANDTINVFRHRINILKKLEKTSLSSSGRIGRFVRFSSRPNPWLQRPIAILGGEKDYIGFELAWFNSRFVKNSSSSLMNDDKTKRNR